jgi:hypothetical protein
MIPLLILGGVLVVAAVFLLAPVRLEVTFREEFTLSVRYLFFRFPLFPGEGQEEQEAPVHEETASQEGEPSKPSLGQKLRVILRREGLQGFLQTLKELSQEVGNASRKLLKQVRLKRFDLYICLGGEEDAAAAAVEYGQVCGIAYTACGIVFGLLPCRKKSVLVDLDYSSREDRVDFSGAVSIRVLFLLLQGLILLYRALPFFRKLQAAEDHIERISRMRKQGETK